MNLVGREPLIINNTLQHKLTKDMSIIYEEKVGSYLGFPIILHDGTLFGTLCAIDTVPYSFDDEEIEIMKSLSRILTNYLNDNIGLVAFSKIEEERQLEKVEAIGKMASGLAHEIGNPMQSIKGFIQYVFKDSNHNKDFQRIVMNEITRVEELISEFVLATQPSSPVIQMNNAIDVILPSVERIKSEAYAKGISITCSLEDHLPIINVEASQIQKVIMNVLRNSLEAIEQEGSIRVVAYRDPFHFLVIEVSDNGRGIPAGIIKKVGYPFFTTKDYGTGLGLSVSKNIIRAHGGTLNIESVGNGTKVSIRLPIAIEK
ncbi:signal transduction histidine kinase [Bacillus mesophilus]|uniref:histidine kinase n=1 Tax=Bacillus mesophilus TaxID=1808955 RepID=A0A6M0QEM1_9BACI|nr:sensor histidine kinase [Bacillus mesophilus]MBM7663491.1 signal transduction histidine kinase [Bacillus mesophilus]NEY74160.1 GAF domain-containing protein [Bacillus mesophilus]